MLDSSLQNYFANGEEVGVAQVSWSTSVRVTGGSTFVVETGPIDAEAIERIEVSIPKGGQETIVNVQIGNAASVYLLALKSDRYEKLTFKVSDLTTDSEDIPFAGAQVYSGGALALLDLDPKVLKFTNNSADDAKVEIFVARDATP